MLRQFQPRGMADLQVDGKSQHEEYKAVYEVDDLPVERKYVANESMPKRLYSLKTLGSFPLTFQLLEGVC